MVDTVLNQINALNTEQIAVRLQLRHIEKFKEKVAFDFLNEQDKHDLIHNLAPIIYNEEQDECAKRFDNFMYGLMLSKIEMSPLFKKNKTQLCNVAVDLAKRTTIPQINAKLAIINSITTDEFWASSNLLDFEHIRNELRELIKFIVDEGGQRTIFTDLDDPILGTKEGQILDATDDFEDYKLKVNRYIEKNKDATAIWKLRNNIALTALDYQTLSNIFTKELGTKDDYKREYGETPFGLLIRKIAKLEHDSAMKVFSTFINEQNLNQQQIVFVHKVVAYVEQNGYMENVSELMKPPFDTPQSFTKLFDASKQKELLDLIVSIKENAENISA